MRMISYPKKLRQEQVFNEKIKHAKDKGIFSKAGQSHGIPIKEIKPKKSDVKQKETFFRV